MTFSSDPFQRLTAGGTFNRTFHIFSERYDLFLIISGIIFVPMALMFITMFQFYGSSMHTLMDSMGALDAAEDAEDAAAAAADMNDQFVSNLGSFGSKFILEYIALLFVAIAGKAAMAHAVAEMYSGRDPAWSDSFKKGISRWCDIFGASMLVGLGLGGVNLVTQIIVAVFASNQNGFMSFLAFLIMCVYLVFVTYVMVSLMILAPVIMVEGNGPVNSLKRCWEISSNNRCYIFCTLFALCMTYYVAQLVLTLILYSAGGVDAIFTTWGAFLVVLPAFIYIPLVVIAETVVYLNIRVQQEGLNHAVLFGELYGEAAAPKDSKYSLVERAEVQEVV